MRVPGKPHPLQFNAARVMLEQFEGPLPADHDASHLCHQWLCINPAHLVVETKLQNQRRRWVEGVPLPKPAVRNDDDPDLRAGCHTDNTFPY